jgi:excisionase family DNA binding protein/prepilin-type N-terminal cleavage/methylation domain-containing protein
MIWYSKKYIASGVTCSLPRNSARKAFTLAEVLTALMILGLMSSSILVVINRCITSSTNSVLQMQAFEVARENMETLLSKDSVKETIENGTSDKYPEIDWTTVVETFYEPITSSMWLRGVCTAKYKDASGKEQTVELMHWLTGLTKEQLLQIMNQQGEELLAAQLLETIEEAAEYANVDTETIEKWIDNGMLTTEDGSFIKINLDIYMQTDGNPSQEDKNKQITSKAELKGQNTGQSEGDIDPKTGLPYEELEKMDISQIWDILKDRKQ